MAEAAVDFEEVLNRLTLHAQSLSTAMVCSGLIEKTLPGGESAEDLAMVTLLKFLDPADPSINWAEHKGEPTTSGVLAYLRKVLTRDYFDLKKSSRYKTTVDVDPSEEDSEGGLKFDQLAVTFETPEGRVLKSERVAGILKHFVEEPELKEIVKLQLDPGGYNAFSNQELAELLGTTVRDIENRKKQIKLRLKRLASAYGSSEVTHVKAKK